jgi:hypothetical protein
VQIGSNFNACIRDAAGLNPGRHIENPAVFSGFITPSREILEYYISYFTTAYFLVCHSLLFTVIQLLDAFAKLRKVAINFVISVRLCACNNSALSGKFFREFVLENFSKHCRENSSFINNGQA